MKTEKRHSFGVIPILREGTAYKVLLVNQRESSQKVDSSQEYWTFAKGTPEEGETPLETAMRETREEVGITFNEVHEEPSFTHGYSFESKGMICDKKVTYFLGFADNEHFEVQEEEVKEAKWSSFENARKQLTFEHSKLLLDEVASYLENLDK